MQSEWWRHGLLCKRSLLV
uniref:Uncharacterized protein n=1 Tax=Anguilla anguilla TaxID=7936 RepID=A0A0E9TXQ1_ANGAN